MYDIVADENMPALALFEKHGVVTATAGRHLQKKQIMAADTLLVRSITQVDGALLEGTGIKFVGSATIGTDHVDVHWLQRHGICFAHAPGCNAMAVAEYVLQAVVAWLLEHGQQPQTVTLAVVGHGNVGSRVASLCEAFGVNVKLVDPLMAQQNAAGYWLLDEVLDADIISCHVPYTVEGEYATHHLFDEQRLQQLQPTQLLINTSRGAVIDNLALKQLLLQKLGPTAWLDVWENEPHIDKELFQLVRMGTPHIAGYTVEGKWRGTWMLYQAWCDFYQIVTHEKQMPSLAPKRVWERNVKTLADVYALLNAHYAMENDFLRLQKSLSSSDSAQAFDRLRRDYGQRFELAGIKCEGKVAAQWQPLLHLLGINLPETACVG